LRLEDSMREDHISVDSAFLLELTLLRLDVRNQRVQGPEIAERLDYLVSFFGCEADPQAGPKSRRGSQIPKALILRKPSDPLSHSLGR